MLKWCRENGARLDPQVIHAAVKHKQLRVLQWIVASTVQANTSASSPSSLSASYSSSSVSSSCPIPESKTIIRACTDSEPEILLLLLRIPNAPSLPTRYIRWAVRTGSLELLQLLHMKGVCMIADYMVSAAETGQITLLQWLHTEHSLPVSAACVDAAAHTGQLLTLKWMRDRAGYAMHAHRDLCFILASGGHLDVLAWAHAIGCDWDARYGCGMRMCVVCVNSMWMGMSLCMYVICAWVHA